MGSCLLTLSPSLIVELTKNRKMSYQRKFQEDMQRATGRFQDLVQENKVMMFSSTNCVYCDVAKETFTSMGTQFKSLEVRMGMLFDWNGEQAWGGRGYDAKHIEVGHWRENRASYLHLWRTGKGRQQWIDGTGIFWKALKHARAMLQGRCHMWVKATPSVTRSPLSRVL